MLGLHISSPRMNAGLGWYLQFGFSGGILTTKGFYLYLKKFCLRKAKG